MLIAVLANSIGTGVVIYIQKSTIADQKRINESMKSYMDIFEVKQLEEYVEIVLKKKDLELEQFYNEAEKLLEKFSIDSMAFNLQAFAAVVAMSSALKDRDNSQGKTDVDQSEGHH